MRRVAALVALTAMVGLFVCPTVACFGAFGWLPRIQFVPAMAAGSLLVLVGIAISVALCGRLYCSVICPLGILQDLFRGIVTLRGRWGTRPSRGIGSDEIARLALLYTRLNAPFVLKSKWK